MAGVFVTGTGTDVGKTFVTAALVRHLRGAGKNVDAYKPVVSGFDPANAAASDPGVLLSALDRAATVDEIERIAPWRFAAPLSPDLAAKAEGRALDFKALVDFSRDAAYGRGTIFIEGVGGIMVPLDQTHTVLDWMSALRIPVLVVAGSYLGTISHTLTALHVMAQRNLDIAGVVVSESTAPGASLDDTVTTIARFAVPIGVVGVPRVPPGALPPPAVLGQIEQFLVIAHLRISWRMCSPCQSASSACRGCRRGPSRRLPSWAKSSNSCDCPSPDFMENVPELSAGGTFDVKSETSMSLYRQVIQTAWVVLAAVASQQAQAQVPVLRGVTGVQIEYQEPINPAHKPIYERLKKRQVLEQYREFMSPLKLQRSLNVSLMGCNGVINAVYQAGRIMYCYELVADMQRQVAETNVLPGFRREDAIVGGFVSTLLHETGHAIFHLLDIPVFGREEDAADAIAAYVSLQFGKTSARRILTGTAFVWRASELSKQQRTARRFEDYSDEHGTDAQRFYNTLCIAHGSDLVEKTNTFADFVPLLPEGRRRQCVREYTHVKNSFARFVLPHVDVALMKKVQATEWLRSEDGTDIAPPQPFGPRSSTGPGGPGPRPSGPGGPAKPQ